MSRKQKSEGLNQPFKGLKKVTIKAQPAQAAAKANAAPLAAESIAAAPLSDDELFARAVGPVAPIGGAKIRVEPPKTLKPKNVNDDAMVLAELQQLVRGQGEFRIDETGEFQFGLAPGVSYRVLEQMKRGGFAFRRHIDLHGHSRDEAHRVLIDFISEVHLSGERCVLVITGRGKGSPGGISVLRETLGRWLSRAPLAAKVLAFCTARGVDGGPGAFYVLLRRLGKRGAR